MIASPDYDLIKFVVVRGSVCVCVGGEEGLREMQRKKIKKQYL